MSSSLQRKLRRQAEYGGGYTRRHFLQGVLGASFSLAFRRADALRRGGIAAAAGGNPLLLPRASSIAGLLSHLGQFNTPSDFQYGGSGSAVSGTTMYFSGKQNDGSGACLGQMTIPTVAQIMAGGHTATTVVAPKYTSVAVGQAASGSWTDVCGSLLAGGFIYSSIGIFYNSMDAQTSVFIRSPSNLSTIGTTPSPVSFGALGLKQSQFPGQMGLLPAVWQPYLGGNAYMVSGLGQGITSTLDVGFGLSTYDYTKIDNAGGTVPMNVWSNYPETDPALAAINTTALWNRANATGGIVGNVLNISAITIAGLVINVGATVYWPGNVTGVTITSPGTGTGGPGTYNLSTSATVSAGTPFWISNTVANQVNGAATGGDDLVSTYDGPLAIGLIIGNSRTIAYISSHHRAVEYVPGSTLACDDGASGSNDPRWVQATLVDMADYYNNIMSGGNVWDVKPYAFEQFPNSATLFGTCPGLQSPGCGNGFMCYDPANGVLYGNGNGFGGSNWNCDAWSVATL